ncbi:MAG TPA: hypothetical protein ENK44_04710 [Caldithrix abyssi]|uniref:Uncharacterized protein n=1 Tax=Caldithrix abyssi TaxID=187145 RepID=A0A7V4WUL5_CALAY|nr:hypothetical protein [Caldithrix abyssi]
METYPEIKTTRKSGEEKFHLNGKGLDHDLLSFWQWSASDLIGNAMRGVLAEYIVAMAVDRAWGCRTEWDAFDIKTKEGIKIEVKSGAYIQSWSQKKLSQIQFAIRPTRAWNSKNNSYSSQAARQSDVYVFCVLRHKDQETIDPLNINQWHFYVLATKQLNLAVGMQKTITLGRLKKLNPVVVSYEGLYASIIQAAGR